MNSRHALMQKMVLRALLFALFLSLMTPVLAPHPVAAQPVPASPAPLTHVPVDQKGSDGVLSKDSFWDVVAKVAARQLVHQLSQSLIEWMVAGIRDGFSFGQPYFIQEPRAFLANVADQSIGYALDHYLGPNAALLCSPFRINIVIGLMSFQHAPPPACTLSQIIANVESMYSNFQTGGWPSLLSISTVNNNAIGSVLVRYDGIVRWIANDADNAKNTWEISAGWYVQGCQEWTETDSGMTCSRSGQVTPGKQIEGALIQVTNTDLQWLGLADEFNEIIVSAISAMITYQLMPALQEGFFGADSADLPDLDLPAFADVIRDDLLDLADSIIDNETGYIARKNDSYAIAGVAIANLEALETCAAENQDAEISQLESTQTNIQTDISEASALKSGTESLRSQVETNNDAVVFQDIGNQLADLSNQSEDHKISDAQNQKDALNGQSGLIHAELTTRCPTVTPQ